MASTSTSKLNSTSTTNSKENFVKSNSTVVVGNNQNKNKHDNHPEPNAHLQNLDNLIGHDDFEEEMDGANEKDMKMRLSSAMSGAKDPNSRGGRKKKNEESKVLWMDKAEETERSRLSR